jgi:ABC-type glycerol-3-phosphate transport system substrate-binding protein
MEYPLAINAVETTHSIQEASHWVWNAGGNFTNTDGSQVIFNQPAALAGFKKYFSLRPFISPVLLKKSLTGGALFINTGETAIHFAAPWLNSTLSRRQAHDGRRPGVAPLPGVVFTGGSSLAIWQHTLHPDEAFAWVRFLTTRPPNGPTKIYRDQVPARRDALQVPLLQNDFFHRTYAQYLESIQRGRSFPTMRLWGAIEDKLVIEISRIWAELFANPDQDLDECLHRHFDPLAQRLNTTLGN